MYQRCSEGYIKNVARTYTYVCRLGGKKIPFNLENIPIVNMKPTQEFYKCLLRLWHGAHAAAQQQNNEARRKKQNTFHCFEAACTDAAQHELNTEKHSRPVGKTLPAS